MFLLRQIWLILTLNCEQCAHLTSDELDRPLNWAEKAAVQLHILICSKSRKLRFQIMEMDKSMKRLPKPKGQTESDQLKLPQDARERIRKKLESAD